MADGNVDNLNIQISAEAKSAEKSLNSLSQTLLKVNKSLQSSVGTIRKVSKEVGTLQYAVNSLGKTSINSSGIEKTINSLRRLLKVDASGFDTDGFRNITDTIRQLGNMPDVSNNVNRFVSSMARLANAGEKTGQTANDIKRLGEQTRLAAKELKGIGDISNELNMFVQSIGRLASAGNKTGQTASSLKTLAKETLEFFNAMAKAPRISENTIRMTQALAQLASAGGRVSTATNTISSAFNKLSSIGGKTLSAMKKVASGIVAAFKQIGNSGKHVDSARFSLGNLLKTAIGFQIGYGLLNFGKQAFELGSAITEVENVVDVAFGSMADKAYEFASTAKEQFGLSELAAKQYSGTMMAMLNASGVSRDAAAEMSTTLAGLAGDLASFYNIETDEAFYKLRSAIAGEVEPMRQLGVSMTVANLQAYALSQGITKSWQSMTQAEQAMLRYNYIMYATAQQQGDFARTSGSFANQLRLLTLNIQQLASTIGQGLIAAVLPALQALNALMSVLQRAAEAFRDFMYVLTGYKPQSSGGIVNDLAGIGDTASDLGDLGSAGDTAAGGLDDATSAAEDLKKALSVLSFDELNQLSDTSVPDASTPSSGSGGGGVGGLGGGSGLGGLDSITDALGKSELPEAVNEWAERIRDAFLDHDWDRLGEEIAWGINKGMQAIYDAINWENVGPKITAFTSAFTQTLNSLVDHIDWDLMGKTVGAGVNTIVNTLNQLIEGFDFTNLGSKLSEGLRGAISEIQWTNLGNLLGNYFMIPWNMFSGFIAQMAQENNAGLTGFEQLGISLGNAFNGIFNKIDFGVIGTTLANGINGAFQVLRNFVATVEWDDLAVNIYTGLNNMINGIDWATAGATLSLFVTELLGTFARVAQETDWEGLGRGIGQFLSNIDWLTIIGQVGTILWEAFSGMLAGLFDTSAGKVIIGFVAGLTAVKGVFSLVDIAQNAIEWVYGLKIPFSELLPFFTGKIVPGIISALTGLSTFMTGPFGIAIAAVAAGAVLIITNWKKIAPILQDLWENVLVPFGEFLSDTFSPIIDGIKNVFLDLYENVLQPLGSFIGDVFVTVFSALAEVLQGVWENLLKPIAQFLAEQFGPVWEAVCGILQNIVIPAIGTVIDVVSELWDNILKPFINWVSSEIGPVFEAAFQTVTAVIETAQGIFFGFSEFISGVFTGNWEKSWEGIKDIFGSIWDGILDFFGGLPAKLLEIGEDMIKGFIEGIVSFWNDAGETVGEFVTDIIKGFTDGFDTHSPSRITEGIGENVGKGLINGIDSQSGDALKTVGRMADSIIDRMQGAMDNMMDNLDRTMDSLDRTLSGAERSANNSAWNIESAFSNLYIPLPHIDWDWNYIDFGDFSFSIPSFKIRWYAKGGLFTKATLAGIGEAGKEAVLPLENRRTMSMIADSIMESGNIGVDEETLANAVAQGVAMAMMNNQGNQTPITVYAELKTESDEVLARAVTRGQQKIDYRNNPTIKFGY